MVDVNTKMQSYNNAVIDCAEVIETIISIMEDSAEKQEGFQHHITRAKIQFAEKIKEVVQHRILPRVPGESVVEFKARLEKIANG